MGGATTKKPKDDESKSRQEELKNLYLSKVSGEEKKLLDQIKIHRFFEPKDSVARQVREKISGLKGDRLPVIEAAVRLFKFSPETLSLMKGYFEHYDEYEVGEIIKSTMSLIDHGVPSANVFYFMKQNPSADRVEFLSKNFVRMISSDLSGYHAMNFLADCSIYDSTTREGMVNAASSLSWKVGEKALPFVELVFKHYTPTDAVKVTKIAMEMLDQGASFEKMSSSIKENLPKKKNKEESESSLHRLQEVVPEHGSVGGTNAVDATVERDKTPDIWDRMPTEEERKMIAESLAPKKPGEHTHATLKKSLNELRNLMGCDSNVLNARTIKGRPEYAKEIIDATILTFKRKSSDEPLSALFNLHSQSLIEEREKLDWTQKCAFDIWFFNSVLGAEPKTALDLALRTSNCDEIFKKLVSVFKTYGYTETNKTICMAIIDGMPKLEGDINDASLWISIIDGSYKDMLFWLDNFQSASKIWDAIPEPEPLLEIASGNSKTKMFLDALKKADSTLKDIYMPNEEHIGDWTHFRENNGFWTKRTQYLIEISNSIYGNSEWTKHSDLINAVIKVVNNDKQLSAFMETFNEFNRLLTDYIMAHGTWKYSIIDDDEFFSPDLTPRSSRYLEIGYFNRNGTMALAEGVPEEDRRILLRKVRSQKAQIEDLEENYKRKSFEAKLHGKFTFDVELGDGVSTWGYDSVKSYKYDHEGSADVVFNNVPWDGKRLREENRLFMNRKIFSIFLNIEPKKSDLIQIFTDGLFEIFAKDELSSQERLKAATEKMETLEGSLGLGKERTVVFNI